jgi:hypothetical protein
MCFVIWVLVVSETENLELSAQRKPGFSIVRLVRRCARLEPDCLKWAFRFLARVDQAFWGVTQVPSGPVKHRNVRRSAGPPDT